MTTEQPDEIAMTPGAIEVRSRMAHEWASSRAPEGVLPWSVRQHFGADVPALLAGVERLRADLNVMYQVRDEQAAELERLRAELARVTQERDDLADALTEFALTDKAVEVLDGAR